MDEKEFLEKAKSDPNFALMQLMLEQTLITGAIVRALIPRERNAALEVVQHLEREAALMSDSVGIAKTTVQSLATSLRQQLEQT